MQAKSKTTYRYQDVCSGDKQKFQHFLKNFGNEFLFNINLDDELLNYEEKNPLDWLIQLNKTRKQITIQNISENITHIISLLDQNATTMPSPEIAEKMNQKNNVVTISPQTDYGLGMHSKNISQCQTKEPDDGDSAQRNLETFQMIAIVLHQHHQKKKNHSKKSPTPKNKNLKSI